MDDLSLSLDSVSELVSDVLHYLKSDSAILWGDLTNLIYLGSKLNPYNESGGSTSDSTSAVSSLSSSRLHINKKMWDEQCGINVPLLYLASIYLYKYAKKHGIDTFLFATRDCCHWITIFNKLFPEENAVYYNCSRNMLDGAFTSENKYYNAYTQKCLKTTISNAIFVDIHGTGKRMFAYCEKLFDAVPYTFLLSATYRKYGDFPAITRKYFDQGRFINLIFDARGSPIEMLNYDKQGTLQTFNRHGPVRDPPEYQLKYLEAYHACVQYMAMNLKELDCDLDLYHEDKLYRLIKKIYRVIQDNKPAVSVNIKHPVKHPKLE